MKGKIFAFIHCFIHRKRIRKQMNTLFIDGDGPYQIYRSTISSGKLTSNPNHRHGFVCLLIIPSWMSLSHCIITRDYAMNHRTISSSHGHPLPIMIEPVGDGGPIWSSSASILNQLDPPFSPPYEHISFRR